MPRYTLIDYEGRTLEVLDAPTMVEAERRGRAHGHRSPLARPYRPADDVDLGRSTGEQLLEAAEDRLAEAFARLGLSDRQVGAAIAGREEQPLDRARRQGAARLREAVAGSSGLGAGQALRGTPDRGEPGAIATPRAPGVYTGDHKLTPDEVARHEQVMRRRESGGWDLTAGPRRREALKQDAETAGALVRAGYDPADVARALGIPVRHSGAATVTVQAVSPAPAVESLHTRGDLVPLVEAEDRLDAALGRLGLTDAERRHAVNGRDR